MEYWLPVFFAGAMGFAMFVYVILDGYDLGVGLLLPAANEEEKDMMIASIGPFWDANETWIVLGVGVLLIAFPKAHGLILTSLYLPVTFMLMGLILRGVSFDFRVKAQDSHKTMWNTLFFVGSLIAATSQGWMLGSYVTGLLNTPMSWLFSVLIALTLPTLYIMLAAAWLLMKTEGSLFMKSITWAKKAILPMGLGLFLISIATPLVSAEIAAKWFSMPNIIILIPIPISCLIFYAGIFWLLRHENVLKAGYSWLIFVCLVMICLLAAFGLAFSIFPDIVIGKMDIWEAASSVEALKVIFVGTIITLPAIIAYSIFVYKIFHGKATHLTYE
ncbi:MAG: cytochrome d ubiquinol oxidase subunit II [Gammaproteobacteria bacterium]|jgi:cytochrome bd ubiquinol oxidase subunit II